METKQRTSIINENAIKLISYVIAFFPLSLAISYFYALGFFNAYGIDFSRYVTTDDIVFIYAKGVWAVALSLMLIFGIFKAEWRFPRFEFLEKPIGTTILKRKGALIILIILGLVVTCVYSAKFYEGFTAVLGFGFGLAIFYLLLYIFFHALVEQPDISRYTWLNFSYLAMGCFLSIYVVPFLIGMFTANNEVCKQNCIIYLNDNHPLEFTNGTTTFYEQTHNHLFILDATQKVSQVIPIDAVKEIRMER